MQDIPDTQVVWVKVLTPCLATVLVRFSIF